MTTTEPTGTRTLQGWVPHLELYTDHGLLHCPVRVVTSRRDINHLPLPERDERGNPIYAMPGGGRYKPCAAKE
jgi:hypothetical protein